LCNSAALLFFLETRASNKQFMSDVSNPVKKINAIHTSVEITDLMLAGLT
jgi:hypothetical protein